MTVHTFIAESATDAVAQIRSELGPAAVVVNVRRLTPEGLARFWQKPRIEVLACRPETPPAENDSLGQLRQEIAALRESVQRQQPPSAPLTPEPDLPPLLADPFASASLDPNGWRIGRVLTGLGVVPIQAQALVDRLEERHGSQPPSSLLDEFNYARPVLAQYWRPPVASAGHRLQVFVGPAGAGKTTCICKWLTQAVLLAGQSAQVWRLDTATANTSEALSIHAEILGLPVERSWGNWQALEQAELGLVDLPGVDWRDAGAVRALAGQLRELPPCQVHLVLNAAYDTAILFAQLRAFASLNIADLVFTHLDEETRWGKLWNFVLGTNYSLGFLSAGQNIPGRFQPATLEQLLAAVFPRK